MSEQAGGGEAPIVNDAITSDDAGFAGSAGDQIIEEASAEIAPEGEESVEATPEATEGEGVQADTVEELQEEVEQAIEDGATEQEVQDMIKEFQIKVNGKEKTVKLDLSDDDAIKRYLQLAEAGQGAMQKSAEMEKLWESEVKALLENPADVLRELGLDPLKLGEEWLTQEVENRKKSPDVLAKEKLERELAEARAKLKEQEDAANQLKQAELDAQADKELNADIDEALKAHEKLPNTPEVRARIADNLLWAMENAESLGLNPDDISAKDVMPSVEREIKEELQKMMESLPENTMEEYIGKKNLERLRQKRLSAAQTTNVSNIKETTESVAPKEDKSTKKKVRSRDYFKNLGR
jgi:hypothetical protein